MIRILIVAIAWLATAAMVYAEPRSAHDFAFTSIDGEPMPLRDSAGRAVLVVSTASLCGCTPQYDDLQALWQDYRDRGLVVLGVPSSDFGQQEPGSEAEIKEFCESTSRSTSR
jgi:glutathione peroxidase